MQKIRMICALGLAICAAVALAFVTFSVALVALTAVATYVSTRLLVLKLGQKRQAYAPARAYATKAEHAPKRVWNDGKGTIIDM